VKCVENVPRRGTKYDEFFAHAAQLFGPPAGRRKNYIGGSIATNLRALSRKVAYQTRPVASAAPPAEGKIFKIFKN
jgi:hypothetical protein